MNLNSTICDLKRLSVHDGPGIRTTIFFKGCSLHCLWCHNPESIDPRPELGFLMHLCKNCGKCAKICDCHSFSEGIHSIDRNRCVGCGKCVTACSEEALTFYGQKLTVEKCADLIVEDKSFYDHSGGGATVSGGEPLLQSDFVAALFAMLRHDGVHTAVDTCGNVPWTAFEKVLPNTDLFLYDFKHADSEIHKKLIGCGNELILANLHRLSESGKTIEIRMPLIPTLNMDEPALHAAGNFLGHLPQLSRVKLLSYHALARNKYSTIGKTDTMPCVESPSIAELQAAAEILSSYGLKIITDKE